MKISKEKARKIKEVICVNDPEYGTCGTCAYRYGRKHCHGCEHLRKTDPADLVTVDSNWKCGFTFQRSLGWAVKEIVKIMEEE